MCIELGNRNFSKKISFVVFLACILIAIFLFTLGFYKYHKSHSFKNLGGQKTEASILEDIISEQSFFKLLNSKYKSIPKTTLGNYEKEVHEYVNPDGSKGYIIHISKTEKDIKYLKIIDYNGSKFITQDWVEVKPLNNP